MTLNLGPMEYWQDLWQQMRASVMEPAALFYRSE